MSIFRDEALRHYLDAEEGRALVRIAPPWTWVVVCTVMLLMSTALVASIVGQVEVNGRGRGILRPTRGVRLLITQLGGTVAQVEAHSGEEVRAGARLLRIDSSSVQAQLLEAERQLSTVTTHYHAITAQQDRFYREQRERLESRAGKAADQIASLRKTVAYQKRRADADEELERKGLISSLGVEEARDALAQAQRQLSSAEAALDQTRQELASLEARRQDELWQRQQILTGAQNRRDSLAYVLRETAVEAPEDGTVEALLVKLGEVVQPAQAVGKLIPAGSSLHVVSFLAERDRGFVKAGDEVRLELDQLPYAEYGTLGARVVRISDDLASPYEIREALGEDQRLDVQAYRVDLDLTDVRAADAAHVKVRTGMLMNVRYTLRRQRLITLVLDPVRRWLR